VADLQSFGHIHVIGVGGAGMSGLAKLLAQQGHSVSGSDLKPGRAFGPLSDLGVECWHGHQPERAEEWALVVASSAVPATDPELTAAGELGTPVWRRPQLLGAFTEQMPAVGFAGTHGKTTSTALAVAAARAATDDPSFLLGGELADLNTNAHLGSGDLFLLESDEAFGTFSSLHHRALLVTSVEADHLDHYESVGALEAAFASVASAVDGPVLACLDDPGARRMALAVGATTYGTSPDADWHIDRVEHGPWSSRFSLTGADQRVEVQVPRPGIHIIRDAAGAVALLSEVGVEADAAAAGIKEFAGVRRRYEVRSRIGGVTVVDDYAHHPTEVAATIAAARLGSHNRVWAVFQPHRFTRTAELATEFGPALAAADRVVVTDVYAAGETAVPGVTGKLILDAVIASGSSAAAYVPDRGDIAAMVAAELAEGDLVLLLGAGDISSVADDLAEALGRAS